MGTITRRDSLKLMGGAIAAPALARRATAAPAPLPTLPTLPTSDALLLQPGNALFDKYQLAYNKRIVLRPRLRALCKTSKAVATMINWARDNHLSFALRAGGHCYEGFSQSDSIVIDTQLMRDLKVDGSGQTVTVGAGTPLGDVYANVNPLGFVFPGGSCATVGVTGHALGGGFGYMGRAFGLACDSLEWAELVDAKGNIVEADATQNPHLFWALRGGGGGSFGAVTHMRLKIHRVPRIIHITVPWRLAITPAVKLMRAWQAWASKAPSHMTTVLVAANAGAGMVALTCYGQSTGTMDEVRHELANLIRVAPATASLTLSPNQSGRKPASGWPYETVTQKAKSDYVQTAMSEAGIATLLGEIMKAPSVAAICDAYGGAVASIADNASAFAHRHMLYSIQYFINWQPPSDGMVQTKRIRDLYAAMRPHVSGTAYVNYPDLDLPDYATAYWGANLPRLKQIKAQVDPDSVFRHAQSVPAA